MKENGALETRRIGTAKVLPPGTWPRKHLYEGSLLPSADFVRRNRRHSKSRNATRRLVLPCCRAAVLPSAVHKSTHEPKKETANPTQGDE